MFPFREQIDEVYSLAACIQMITGTEQNQQNIYFQMVQSFRSISPDDCADKAIASTSQGPVLGDRERICRLIEDTVNRYDHSRHWRVYLGDSFRQAPALIVLQTRKNDPFNSMVRGHPALVTAINGEKATIYDPVNEEPVDVLKMRLKPVIKGYYNLTEVDSDGKAV